MANESHNNDTSRFVTTPIALDDYSAAEKIIVSVLTALFCAFGFIAVISLNRTKTTPKTARFLSSALIIYDMIAVVLFAIRKFILEPNINVFVQVLGVAGAVLAYITVGLMSLERLFIFCAPNIYLQRASVQTVRKCAIISWAAVLVAYFFVRYALCFLMFEDATMLDVIGRCNPASFIYYGFLLVFTIIISFLCYFKIICILRSQTKTDSDFTTFKSIHFYKSTSLVFVYIVTITVLTLAYALLLTLGLATEPLRIMTDVINMVQSVVDPCMYILWYKETRMEMLKMLTNIHPCFAARIEAMRMEIFNIVTSETRSRTFNNRVHPLGDSKVTLNSVKSQRNELYAVKN